MDDRPKTAPTEARAAKRFGRRTTLKLLGATVSGAAVHIAGAAGAQPGGAARGAAPRGKGRAWQLRPLAEEKAPRAFTAAELAALAAVVDRIIPDTDTPGARTAGVHTYLDDVCVVERDLRERLKRGLARLEEHAQRRGSSFAQLPAAAQDAILQSLDEPGTGEVEVDYAGQPRMTGAAASTTAVTPDDRSFFSLIKARTLDAYYKSEMGQIGELEWIGHEFHDSFPGRCEHPEALHHPRPKWPRARA